MPSPDTCRLPMPQQAIVVWSEAQQRLMNVLLPLHCIRLVGLGKHGGGAQARPGTALVFAFASAVTQANKNAQWLVIGGHLWL